MDRHPFAWVHPESSVLMCFRIWKLRVAEPADAEVGGKNKTKQKTAQEKRISFDNMGLSELGTQPVHYSSGKGNLFKF